MPLTLLLHGLISFCWSVTGCDKHEVPYFPSDSSIFHNSKNQAKCTGYVAYIVIKRRRPTQLLVVDINTTSCCGYQHNFLLWIPTQLLVVDICIVSVAVKYEPLYMQVNTSNSEIGVEILGVGLYPGKYGTVLLGAEECGSSVVAWRRS